MKSARKLPLLFVVATVVLLLAGCSEDGGAGSFNFCGQTYNDPGTAHTSLSTAKDFGVMAPGCVITVQGTLLERFDENYYSGDLGRASGLYVEMTWPGGNDLDVRFYAQDGSSIGWFDGNDSAGSLEEMVPLELGAATSGLRPMHIARLTTPSS